MASFADRFKEALELRGLSAAEFSRLSGTSEGTLSNYKKGLYEPKQRRLELYSKILGVSIPWLMGANPSPSSDDFLLSEHEKKLILMYRRKRELQPAVDKLLDISESNSIAADAADTVENLDAKLKKVSVEKR